MTISFWFCFCNNSGDVFLQFVIVNRIDQILPAFDGEYDLDVNLSVGIGHERLLMNVSALRPSKETVNRSTNMAGLTALLAAQIYFDPSGLMTNFSSATMAVRPLCW